MSLLPAPFLLPVDWWALGAVLALSVGAMLILLMEFLPARPGSSRAAVVALAALGVSALAVTVARDARRTLFSGMFVHDGFTVFFTLAFCAIGAAAVLLSWDYVKRTRINHAEYYALLLCATLGMILMAAANDLITVFLGLELMSLALYVLVGFRRNRLESNEAALKYFLLGAFASGFFLYGIALLYGATGTTSLSRMAEFLAGSPLRADPLLLAGGLLLLIGFFFKVAAVPFHMWTPDAYEGAPTSVTAFMSVGAKAAAFAALLRFGLRALGGFPAEWVPVLGAVAMITMTVGNITALLQNNLKRMLAYSSIAHAGYVLVAVAAGGAEGASAALFYLAVYSVMNLGAFGVLTVLGRGAQERVLMADVAGLGFRKPLIGLALATFMISLGGIPPTAGFMGKVTVFAVALKAGLLPLVIVGVLNSVVSVYYYLRVTVAMYMQEPQGEPTEVSWTAPAAVAIVLALALTLWWGVQAGGLVEQAQRSVLGLL
jgi:NADH-quinone oxidoreductase subunit N